MNERWFWDDFVLVRSSVSLAKHVHQVEANYLPECRGHGGLGEMERERDRLC